MFSGTNRTIGSLFLLYFLRHLLGGVAQVVRGCVVCFKASVSYLLLGGRGNLDRPVSRNTLPGEVTRLGVPSRTCEQVWLGKPQHVASAVDGPESARGKSPQ